MMVLTSLRRRPLLVVLGLVVLAGLGVAGYFLWLRPKPLPGPETAIYQEYVAAFQTGTAALDVGRDEIAEPKLTEAIKKIPEEPAAWVNRAILYLRTNRFKEAERDLKRAQALASDSPEIESLLGLLAQKQGATAKAISHLRKAVKQKPRDLATQYALGRLLEKTNDEEYQQALKDILAIQPNNLKVLIEHAKVATLRRDAAALKETLTQFSRLASTWSPGTQDALKRVEKAAEGPLPGRVPGVLPELGNLLLGELGFTRGARAVNSEDDASGESFQQFLRLAPVRNTPAPADLALTFTPHPIDGPGPAASKEDVVLPVWLTGAGKPAVFAANAKQARRIDAAGFQQPFPSGPKAIAPTAHGLLALDWNNDYRTDILLAGAGGLRFWEQKEDGTFADVTSKTELNAAILEGDYFGAWAADVEMDGDLDIVLAQRTGPPVVLRNNRDGTFKAIDLFPGVEGMRAFAWADLDNDGAPDAVLLDAKGKLHVFANERQGLFHAREVLGDLGRLIALTAADLNDDGIFDLAALRADGTILRLSDRDKGKSWEMVEMMRWSDIPADAEPGSVRLLVGDLDNNGGFDLIAAGSQSGRAWLSGEDGKFKALEAALPGRVFALADLTGKGRLDPLAVSEEGKAVRLANRGTHDYRWQDVFAYAIGHSPTEKKATGDNRINSFAIGSEVEARSGSLIQKQIIASPYVHFGLGEHKTVPVLRFVWPNGYSQIEFDQPADTIVQTEQRLKGSCPFLFADDGKEVRFVTDFMWSTPLGMYIGGQEKSGFLQTQDWVKIRGDQLAARDGIYDLRVQANLWETHFFDHLSLIVADHPPDTEVFVDERFALTPMTPALHATTPPRPVAKAWDHNGTDVTEVVRAIDGRYLDTCGRGPFQGVTRDHWVECDLGDDAPREGPVWLLAHGWIHPTDSSINVAIAQGKHEGPRPLVLEVPDGKGGWKVGRPALGFPAGKNKTIMIRLDGIEGKGVSRRFRLRTNMEIYWDALSYASALDAKVIRQKVLAPETAELRYCGILEMTQANESSPELPHYDKVSRGGQRWRDLIGYYTRYGDVRELLAKIDDRYVIVNAGDEIAMRFTAPPAPPAGWKRDFVWVCEGWVKDGDFNTAFSKTVLPLPSHDQMRYDRPPGRLEDDPVYQRFPEDWRNYHTRYVTPYQFERGLRSFRRP